MFNTGYFTALRVFGAPLRIHWSTPLGLLLTCAFQWRLALGTGIVYSATLGGPSPDGWEMGTQLTTQAMAVGVTIIWAAAGTAIAIFVAKLLTGLRVKPEVEREGLDLGEHGERAYNY